ncbi:MAG: hypothetical protein A2X46_06325 [Lentisphaerae bacterium GWF2_57_35]|nr:MAG: hypothetical protein A2X46_06325 [Lentisphaerae bacterium GWF2_57_35]
MANVSKGWKIFSWACLLAGVYCLATLLLILIAGGEWDGFVSVNHPKKRFAVMLFGLAGWYLTRHGFRKSGKAWMGDVGKIVLFGISLAISFLAGEAALRAILARSQGDGSLHKLEEMREKGKKIQLQSFHPLAAIVRLSPNKRLAYELMPDLNMPFGGRRVKTNADGMRDDVNYPKEKAPGTVRILGIGDSGMFGWNMAQGDEYLSILRKNLQQRPGRYEVMNLAVPGYNTFQELEILRFRGLAYRPDIVVVGWCDNDFGAPFFLVRQKDFRGRDVSYLYHLLFNRKEFQRLIKPEVLKSSEIDPAYVDPVVVEYARVSGVKKAMEELKALSEQQDFKLLVYGPMGKDIREICDALGIAYADTWIEISETNLPPDYAVHFMHPGAGGHRMLGETLEKVLERKGWL